MSKKQTKQLLASNVDFIYNGVECEYETNYNCEGEGCHEEGMCRCGTISDGRVTQVYPKRIIDAYAYSKLEEDSYYLDRILSLSGGYDTSNYEVYGYGDYYGEQAYVRFYGETELHTKYQEVSKLSFTDAVKQLLIWEYGFLLDELKGDNYKIVNVEKENLVFGSGYNKVDQEYAKKFSDWEGIVGVVVRAGDKYRVIDGHHRIWANNGTLRVILAC